MKIKINLVIFAVGLLGLSSAGLAADNNSQQVNALLSQAQARSQFMLDSNANNAPATSAFAAGNPTTTTNDNSANTTTDNTVADQSSVLGDTPVSQQAFIQTVRNMLPLTPAQVRTLRGMLDRTQRAANEYPGTPPRPTSSSVLVNLAPGSTPPIVRLRKGFVTSLVFLDSTGAPWPIEAYDIGDPKAFNVQWNKTSNRLLVQALNMYESGNLAVVLKGEDTPIMVTLMPGQTAVDYRVDMRVPGLGPNANPVLSDMPSAQNPKLLDFLNGVPPEGAQSVQVTGGDCDAWVYQKHLFLRTGLTVLSPSWLATMASPDGTHVYEVMKTPLVLASDQGQIVQLAVQGL